MGIYFIAAGSSSKNRQKSLDKGFSLEQIRRYLPTEISSKLGSSLEPNQLIYVWGANKRSLSQLEQVSYSEPVVDVKNKKVMQVFDFCFYYKTSDSSLQEYIGWDSEKPPKKRRPYQYVFFLKSPKKSLYSKKNYYAEAFDQTHNQNWLVGQRYFNDEEVDMALERKNKKSIEGLLGLSGSIPETPHKVDKSTFKRKRVLDTLPQKQFIIEENQTGISYSKLFGKYLEGINKVTLVDPYIRKAYQFKYFMEFAQVITEHKPNDKRVDFKLLTRNHQDSIPDFEIRFEELAESLKVMNIHFSYTYDDHIHDRYLQMDNGWKIILGRGLDIFHCNKSRFSIAQLNQALRKCKACEITYIRKEKMH